MYRRITKSRNAVKLMALILLLATVFTVMLNISAPSLVNAAGENTGKVSSSADLPGKRIGVQLGTTGDTIATEYEKKNDGTTVQRFNKAADAVQALKQGKVDCMILDKLPSQYFLNQNSDIKMLDEELQKESYAMCVKKGNKELLDKLNAAIDKLDKDGTLESIEKNFTGSEDELGKTPYKAKDVERNGKLVVATNAEFAPYEYRENGEITGIDMQIVQAIADELGMELKIEDMHFDSIIAAVQSGKADLGAAGMSVTEDRKKNVDFTKEYTETSQVIIVKNDEPVTTDTTVRSSEDLPGKRIGVQLGTTGDTIATEYEKKNDGTTVQRFNKAADAVQALKQGKVDCMILDKLPSQYFLNQNSDIKMLDEELQKESYAMCVKKGNKELLDKLNAAIDKLDKDGTLESIEKNFTGSEDELGKTPYKAKDVERNGKLVVATNAEFAPYEYRENGEITGIDMQIVQAIADELGMELKIEDMHFDSIIAAVQSGKADLGAAGMSVTEDRKKNVDFTKEYTETSQVIIVKNIEAAAAAAVKQDNTVNQSFTDKLYQNFVEDDRFMYLLTGLLNTLLITVLAMILGLVLGTLIAVVRSVHDINGKLKILNAICKIYLTIIRGTPAMIQLLIIYYVIFASVDVSKILVAVAAFGLNSAAYVAEIIRSGITSVDKGQFEAGRSLGLTTSMTMKKIILPQALKNILPALGNELISLLKETAISGYIGLNDLTKGGDIIRSQTFDAFLPLIAVALIYLAIVMLLTFGVGRLERRLKKDERN